MSFKKKSAIIGTLASGALALGALASNAYAQEPTTRSPPFYDSLQARSHAPVSGLFASPFEWYCPTEKNTICIRPTKIDSTRITTNRSQRQQAPIYTYDLDLTAAGNGIFISDFIYNYDISEGELPFNRMFGSTLPIRVHFEDARTNIEARIRSMGPDSALTGEQRAFKQYLMTILPNTSRNDSASLRILNRAAADLVISPNELYNNGQLTIKPDLYVANISNGKASLSMIMYIDESGRLSKSQVDSIVRERTSNSHEFVRYDLIDQGRINALQDSLRKERFRADSIARERRRIPESMAVRENPPEFVPQEKKEGRGLEAMFEVGGTTRGELSVGALLSAHSGQWGIGAFGNYFVVNNNESQSQTDTTQRSTELIGPGTYKDRTDFSTVYTREHGNGVAGMELTFAPASWLDLAYRVGAEFEKKNSTETDTSVINITRNGQSLPGQPTTIENSQSISSNDTRLSMTAGARFYIGKLNLGVYYNRVGKKNRGIISGGFRF